MIIVTGATGLVGSHLLYELCSRGENPVALTRDKPNIRQVEAIFRFYSPEAEDLLSRIDWREADVCDYARIYDLVNKGDEVYHCAAQVVSSKREKQRVIQTNISGTAHVVNACLEKGARKLCHVSSVAAVGKAEAGLPADETCIWDSTRRHTVYSLSKFHSEMEVWRGIEEGLNAVIVNPSIIIGPTLSNKGTGALLQAARQGIKFHPPGSMGFVDVRDVARIMILLMKSDISGERFILNSENLSYKQFLTMAASQFGKPAPTIPVKRWMAYVAVGANTVLSFLQRKPAMLTREIIQSAFANDSFSAKKLTERLQYDFIPISQSLENVDRFYHFLQKR
jgi:nucleoside-diphosphate-sugar epimerase